MRFFEVRFASKINYSRTTLRVLRLLNTVVVGVAGLVFVVVIKALKVVPVPRLHFEVIDDSQVRLQKASAGALKLFLNFECIICTTPGGC